MSEYQVGGTLSPDHLSYIKRQADDELYNNLKAGNFCYVLNSRQVGKSSLQGRIRAKLTERENFKCAEIDLSKIGSDKNSVTQDRWYYSIIKNLAKEFDVQIAETISGMNNWWDNQKNQTYSDRLDSFIEELLNQFSQNILIVIDEIDSVLSLDFSTDDFFAFIRSCYNGRANNYEYNRLNFCLIGVASPSDLIQDKNRTPFNIGVAIDLKPFQFDEVEPLIKPLKELGERCYYPQEIMRNILDWSGGQPFLTQKICSLIYEESKTITLRPSLVKNIVKSNIINNWKKNDHPKHLETIEERILRDQKILAIYKKLLLGEKIEANGSEDQIKLKLSGLVVEKDGFLEIFSPIYKEIFSLNWFDKQDFVLKNVLVIKKIIINLWRNKWVKYPLFFVLGLSLVIILYTKYKPITIADLCPIQSELLSCGEKNQVGAINFSRDVPPSPEETNGRNQLAKGDYQNAIKDLEKAWKTDKDPSLLIALNNAKIMRDLQTGLLNKKQVYAVAVAVAFNNTPDFISKYTLYGVAQKQEEFNKSSRWQLLVLMADDQNDPKQAQKIATEIGKTKPIFGIIGHYSSSSTAHVINIYNQFKISQIASTAIATREAFKENYIKYIIDRDPSGKSELDFSFFFRPIGTAKEDMENIFKYINRNYGNKKKVIIFYDDQDIVSFSQIEEAKKQIEEAKKQIKKQKISIIVKEITLRNKNSSALRKEIDKLKNDPSINPENTFILFLSGAYKDSETGKSQAIVDENKGHFFIIGNNPAYTPQLLNDIKQNEKIRNNIVLSSVWFPSDSLEDQERVKKFQKFWNTEEDLTRYFAQPYDSVEMFIQAVSKQLDSGEIPTREGINNALLSTDFEGMTGHITLIQEDNIKEEKYKGDRQNATFVLIKPDCNENNQCKWKRIE